MSSLWKNNNNNHNPYVWRRNITAGTNNRSSTRTNITWSPDGASSNSTSSSRTNIAWSPVRTIVNRNRPTGQKYFTYTAVGHTLNIAAVQKLGGMMEGKWYIRCSGPSVLGKSGVKTLYCEPSMEAAKIRASRFLNCAVSAIVPLECVRVVSNFREQLAASSRLAAATSSSFNFATTSDDNNKTVYRRTKKRKQQENSSVSSSYKDSKQFKLESKTWKKEWGYGADFIEWQEKNSMDGAVLDLTTANGTMLKGGSNSNIRNTSKVINLIDDDDDDGSGMFGMKKRKFAF